MRDLPSAVEQFSFHPATEETAPLHADVRSLTIEYVKALWDTIPDGPEKTLWLRNLQQASMYANLAIALTAPVDMTHQDIARVLPDA